MKRAIMLALMMTLLCACGNAGRSEEKFSQFRENVCQAEEMCFTMAVSADLGDEVFSCRLDCRRTQDSCRVAIVEPEGLQGITADVRKGTVEYDGVELYVGELPDELSPIACAGQFAHALSDYFVQEVHETDGVLAARCYLDERSDITVFFDGETMTPLRMEIFRDGERVMDCEIADFVAKQ